MNGLRHIDHAGKNLSCPVAGLGGSQLRWGTDLDAVAFTAKPIIAIKGEFAGGLNPYQKPLKIDRGLHMA